MMPRLGALYDLTLKCWQSPRPEYLADDYFALDLPVAPAIMVGAEVVTEGSDVEGEVVEAAIRRQLGLPESATDTQ